MNSFINSFFTSNFKINEKKKNNEFDYFDGTHYITIKDELLNQEKIFTNDTYVNKITIKNVTKDNSGVYVCLAATTNGYTVRKAYLKVKSTDAFITDKTNSFLNNYRIKMNNLMIVIIPVVIILLFSTLLIIYLKCIVKKKSIKSEQENKTKYQLCIKMLLKLFNKSHKDTKNFPIKTRDRDYIPNVLPLFNGDRNINEYIRPIDDAKYGDYTQRTSSVYLSPNNVDPSTTITTLLSNSDSLNAPSVIYYKVLDFNQNKFNKNKLNIQQKDDIASATTSCFYYQLNDAN